MTQQFNALAVRVASNNQQPAAQQLATGHRAAAVAARGTARRGPAAAVGGSEGRRGRWVGTHEQ